MDTIRRTQPRYSYIESLPIWSRQIGQVPSPTPQAPWRPLTRGDCMYVPRPCPFVGCRYNTMLDVLTGGSIEYHRAEYDDVDPELSCALDIADSGICVADGTGEILQMVMGVKAKTLVERIQSALTKALRMTMRYDRIRLAGGKCYERG